MHNVSDYTHLIGKQLSGKLKSRDYIDRFGKTHIIKSQSLDSESIDFLNQSFNNQNFRIKLQGLVYTMDFNPHRFNIELTQDFVISRIYLG